MKWVFLKDAWQTADFRYVYSPRTTAGAVFTQKDTYIQNQPTADDYEYVCMLTEAPVSAGAFMETHCAFEGNGAPLLVLSNDMHKTADGFWQFGLHYEIVAYKGGVNVWKLVPEKDTVVPQKLLGCEFAADETVIHTLSVRVLKGRLEIRLNDAKMEVSDNDLPEIFHAGLTACEGICRFYDFSVTE